MNCQANAFDRAALMGLAAAVRVGAARQALQHTRSTDRILRVSTVAARPGPRDTTLA